jgi:hypothetical protein
VKVSGKEACPSLIQNGDFEIAPWGSEAVKELLGWKMANKCLLKVQHSGVYGKSHGGHRMAIMAGETAVTMEAEATTVQGVEYEISFWFSG